MHGESTGYTAGPPLSAWRTIRFAVREAWDSLGLLCAASMTLFVAASIPIFLGLRSILFGILAACFLTGPLFAGACFLAHKVYSRDEPGYADLWRGFRQLYLRASAICAVQALGFAIVIANIVFYGQRSGFGFLLATVLALYLLVFWSMNCLFHYPLLAAVEEGIIRREEGGKARFASIFRNALLLSISSPIYAGVIVLFLAAVTVPLVISAVGMALVGSALPAFVAMRAARDHLINRGILEPDPDPDEPVTDEVWKLRG